MRLLLAREDAPLARVYSEHDDDLAHSLRREVAEPSAAEGAGGLLS